ncbi:hypothetical protein R1flu_025358 [Riccia fluitans]|uniref:Uncharacterized protein n=1 Tax=Riccia fluitans TaxID=41844 RepID=A0ABD1Y0G7_9MARC
MDSGARPDGVQPLKLRSAIRAGQPRSAAYVAQRRRRRSRRRRPPPASIDQSGLRVRRACHSQYADRDVCTRSHAVCASSLRFRLVTHSLTLLTFRAGDRHQQERVTQSGISQTCCPATVLSPNINTRRARSGAAFAAHRTPTELLRQRRRLQADHGAAIGPRRSSQCTPSLSSRHSFSRIPRSLVVLISHRIRCRQGVRIRRWTAFVLHISSRVTP